MNNKLHIISHTHWDREWYLPFQGFRYRLVNLIDNLLTLLDSDAKFRCFHLDAQTIVLEDYLEIRPQNEEKVRNYIRNGRILVGPWYLQNDEFLVSGEATIRNLLRGTRQAEEYGACMRVGYLPDQFGNISQMPQILQGFGIDSCIFGRGYDASRHGTAEFHWEGADGSTVLAVNLTCWYNNAQRLPEDALQAWRLLEQGLKRLEPYTSGPHHLMMNGVDHLEAQENLTGILAAIQKLPTGSTEVLHSSLPEYIAALKNFDATNRDVFKGELREGDDYHILAGTLSSRVKLKQENFRLENEVIHWVEPLAGWNKLAGVRRDWNDHLDYAWKLLLSNHPHDSICGCSVDPVHDDMEFRFRQLSQVLAELLNDEVSELTSLIDVSSLGADDYVVWVFNNQGLYRGSVLEAAIDLPSSDSLSNYRLIEVRSGREIPFHTRQVRRCSRRTLSPINLPGYQRVNRCVIEFEAENVPPFGYCTYALCREKSDLGRAPGAEETDFGPADCVLENEFLRAEITPDGTVDILHKETGRIYRGLGYFEDGGDAGDAYVYTPPKRDTVITTKRGTVRTAALVAKNDLVTAYRVDLDLIVPESLDSDQQERIGETSMKIEYEVRLRKHLPYLEYIVKVDNQAKDHRLRVMFPTSVETEYVYAGGQLDIIRRHHDQKKGWLRVANTAPNYGFVDVNNGSYGIAFFNQGLHEYEFFNDPGRTLALTLLRCVEWIGDKDFLYPAEDTRVPGAQCQGNHTFRFAIYPHMGDHLFAGVWQEAYNYLNPLRTAVAPVDRKKWQEGRPWVQDSAIKATFFRPDPNSGLPRLPLSESFYTLEGENIVLTAVKSNAARDGLIFRLLNLNTTPEQACLKIRRGCADKAYETNLEEQRIRQVFVGERGQLELHFRGREIKTVEVVLSERNKAE